MSVDASAADPILDDVEKSLPLFGGTLLRVTHDRHLLARARLNRYAVTGANVRACR